MTLVTADGTMPSFQTFLAESKNLHLEHVEEEVLNNGYAGAVDAINFLNSIKEMLDSNVSSSINVTVKWDGAPAVIAGINPDNQQFFVGTKAVFNKNPKINYTEQDIDQNHPGELAEKLKVCLRYLPQLGIKEILQGDMMFGPGDVEERTIGGTDYLTFKPNTILYAVPVDSRLGTRIAQAQMGIIFHTRYRGDAINSLQASYNVNVGELRQTREVWFDDATYRDESGTVTLTADEGDRIDQRLDDAREALEQIGQDKLKKFVRDNPKLIELIKMHLNSKVRQGQHIGDVKQHVDHLYRWIHERFEKEAEGKKTEKGAAGQREKKQTKLQVIDKQRDFVTKLFKLIADLNEAKVLLVRHLEQVENIGHYIETENGLQVTSPEGFVAVDHLSDRAVKLVDRLTFSRANFTAAQDWKK